MSAGEKIFQACNTVFLILFSLTMLYPFVLMLAMSLNEGMDTAKGGIYLLPRAFTLFNYEVVLNNPFIKSAYLVTVGRTVIGTALSILVTALFAYGLSYRNVPFRRLITVYAIIPMLFNGGLVPFYLQLKSLHLLNTFWVFVIPYMFNIWNMFVMYRFFRSTPEELREAAEIDGANPLQILFRIIFPVSLPMLAALSLFTAVGHWNDWFAGAFFVTDNQLVPVQTYLQKMLSIDRLEMIPGGAGAEDMYPESKWSDVTLIAVKMATVMVGTLPILFVYPFLQKYFVKGIMIGSLKE
jgi:putative aldouronate transport system permease protein